MGPMPIPSKLVPVTWYETAAPGRWGEMDHEAAPTHQRRARREGSVT